MPGFPAHLPGPHLPTDARVFLGRLTHLDPDAVVRLRPAGPGRTALWARLPWGALVTRELAVTAPGDVTVGAAALLAAAPGDLPPRRDHDWRWPLPPGPGAVLEEIPADQLAQLAAAAAGTLREVTRTGVAGRPVGSRVVREALLDHVPLVVEDPGTGRVEVPQRLVQAVVRMGFLGTGDAAAGTDAVAGTGAAAGTSPGGAAGTTVRVRQAGRWVGLAARYGTGWLPPPGGPLALRPA